MRSPALQMRKQRPNKVMKFDPSLHHPVLTKQNPQLSSARTPKPQVPDYCVTCLGTQQAEGKSSYSLLKMRSFSTFHTGESQREQ